MGIFIDDLIPEFYEPVGPSFRKERVRGQLCRTFITYPTENLEFWRPVRYDVSRTLATEFRITPAGHDAFARASPLHTPPLKTNEEFVVVRGKPRPVIVVSPAPAHPGVQPIRGGGQIYRRMALVVPIFGLVDRITGQLKYPEGFVDRVRILEFPEFLYLPTRLPVLPSPSIARLSEMCAVYEPHTEPMDLRLSQEVQRIFEGQLQYLFTGQLGERCSVYREQLLHQEPKAR